MKRIIALLLAVMMVIGLSACGGDSAAKSAAGTYKGEYTKMVGDSDDAKSTDAVFTLTLESNGKGKHERDGLTLDVTWELNGEEFKMQETFLGMGIDYTGTLKDGKLDIFNGDPTDIWTVEYVYNKQ